MKFDDLDEQMRVFETAHDHRVLPGIFMVVRLDGRSFTRMTREVHPFEAPFDVRFRDLMTDTTAHLMEAGFDVRYGYTQSDEISLLLAQDDNGFGRKLRKLESVLAGEASAKFSLGLGAIAAFDARVSQLPNPTLVVRYFRWRQEDAHRNALNSHCYWMLRKEGLDAKAATQRLSGTTVAAKNELLFQRGINFNDLPAWQKRGMGLSWESYEKPAVNPHTGTTTIANRRRIRVDTELPIGDDYASYVEALVG
jgi:tRNA(His) guanylyltransferase